MKIEFYAVGGKNFILFSKNCHFYLRLSVHFLKSIFVCNSFLYLFVSNTDSVRIAQQVQVDEIPLPDTPEMPLFCKYYAQYFHFEM